MGFFGFFFRFGFLGFEKLLRRLEFSLVFVYGYWRFRFVIFVGVGLEGGVGVRRGYYLFCVLKLKSFVFKK